jgi:hypothetical protein
LRPSEGRAEYRAESQLRATRDLAYLPVAARDALALFSRAAPFFEQLGTLMNASCFAQRHSAFFWFAFPIAHPNRATEIVPLISGNSTR